MQDYTWSAFLREAEADEDGCEGDCSKVEDPGPTMVSSVVWICSSSRLTNPASK
jgi:hypothetical protein